MNGQCEIDVNSNKVIVSALRSRIQSLVEDRRLAHEAEDGIGICYSVIPTEMLPIAR